MTSETIKILMLKLTKYAKCVSATIFASCRISRRLCKLMYT